MTSRQAVDQEFREALLAAGEVGRDLLAVDWEETPIGPPEAWPQSLRTVVRTIVSSRFAMWMAWGPELTFFCNEAYRRDTLGKKYPWALGRPARQVWTEIWPDIGPRIESVLSTGEATWDESLLLMLERSGYMEETYHTFSYSPLADDDGNVAGMLCVVTEDTDRVIGERRMGTLLGLGTVPITVHDERAFLKASARQLAANGRSLPFTAVYLFDDDANAHLAATTGFASDHPAAPPLILAGDPAAPWPAAEVLAGERDVIAVHGIDKRFEGLPTGLWHEPPREAVVAGLPAPSGARPFGFIVVGANKYRPVDDVYHAFVRVIAQRLATGVASARAYAAELRRSQQLAELDRAKTAFFSNVSHEFRTPLTLILAPLRDALEESAALDTDQVEMMHRNGLRLLKLVNTLLDFSRLEAGRMRPSFRPVAVGHLTSELVATFSDACRRAGIELSFSEQTPAAAVYLDPEMWERIVLNLLSNAFKVTLSGSIKVELRALPDAIELAVADTGPGIAWEEQERVFERFYRVKGASARSHEGAGIGLALVRELVEFHGGEVSLNSVVGQGTTFTVTIPLGREHLPPDQVVDEPVEVVPGIADLYAQEAISWLPSADREPLPARVEIADDPAPAPDRARLDTSRSRVLIADDNQDLRRYLTRLLSPYWQVEAVGDGAEALRIAREDPPDLVVTDVMMPGLDGFALLAELRGRPETQELPVIMLSAHAAEEASIEGLEAGADDYLAKPFSGRELLARVRSHLELSLVRRQASEDIRAQRLLLEQTLTQLPAGVIVVEAPTGKILLSNRQAPAILGDDLTEAEEISGYLVDRWFTLDRQPIPAAQAPLGSVIHRGEAFHDDEVLYRRPEGGFITLRISAAPISDAAGQIVAGVVVFQDISRRVQGERLLASQRDVMAMIAAGAPLAETLTALVTAFEKLSNRAGRASIMLAGSDGTRLLHGAAPSLPEAYNRAIDGIPIGPGVGSCGTAAHRRETVVVTDTQTDPLWADFRELAAEHGLRACWSTPVLATSGALVGTFAIYHGEPAEASQEEREIVALLSRTAAVAIERDRDVRARERQLAELQSSLLPPRMPKLENAQVAARFHPGDRTLDVGGDFYDLFALPEGAWGLVIGDVCGHGAQAAAVTGLTRHTTHAIASRERNPGEVLRQVSSILLGSGYDRYCTAVYGRLEPVAGGWNLKLAAGGHPPPIVRRADGATEVLSEHGPVLGIFDTPSFPLVQTELRPGDTLLLDTDGLIERNPRVDGEQRLARLFEATPGASAGELLAELERAALGAPVGELPDDVAMLVLHVG
ncbi:MAG TPA: SpoIIE family protein phosphatase [Solirubrobacteraceae bacterium]|nr:SpoIIE family protein phosphatase [Solirubrobacteraceae bacterium]